jgi:hypothetical protein
MATAQAVAARFYHTKAMFVILTVIVTEQHKLVAPDMMQGKRITIY